MIKILKNKNMPRSSRYFIVLKSGDGLIAKREIKKAPTMQDITIPLYPTWELSQMLQGGIPPPITKARTYFFYDYYTLKSPKKYVDFIYEFRERV